MDIQQLFQDRLPYHPRSTDVLGDGLHARPKTDALRCRYIQPNPPQKAAWMVFDLDYQGAAFAWEDRNLPVPTIIVANLANGHAHLFYGMEAPVCTSVNARIQPQRYFKAVKEAMRVKLAADPGYKGFTAKNPLHPHWHTQWMPKLYDLGELAEYVDLSKHALPPTPAPEALGRNCTLFDSLSRWAYRQVLAFKRAHRSFERWQAHVLDQAEAINVQTFAKPLSFSEVKSTAKSVAKWVWQHFTEAAFSAIQSARGRKGGRPRTTTQNGEPWTAEGISRASWYYKRKLGLLPSAGTNPV